MADYVAEARRAARRYGLDPNIFVRQIRAESGFNPNARSPAGAQGIAQIMPATARGWGVDPSNPRQALNAAAKNMARYVDQYGSYENALRAYNAGPGRIQASKSFAETNNYVAKILGGRDPERLDQPDTRDEPPSARGGGAARPGASTRTTVETSPGVDNRAARGALVQSFLEDKGADVLDFAMQARQLQDIPATTTRRTVQVPGTPGGTGRAASAGGGQVSGGGSGARAALSWAQSKLNDPGARETGGANRGRLPDFLNQRFGFGSSGGQPWCAMFTSAAVTKGGAPSSARTASVAQVRQKAQSGQGYVRGYISGSQARPGDLILFGNSHIGMVKSVSGGKIRYVGGNQSNAVTEGTASAGGASIVRPKYGARRR